MQTKITNIFAVFLLLFTTSCGLMYRTVYGIDTTPNWNSDEEIIKQAEKYNIPSEYTLVLDTTYFTELKNSYDGIFDKLRTENDSVEFVYQKTAFKDDTQPAQFRLFDSTGNELFKMVNCYLNLGLNWNVDGCLDVFPYKTDIESLNRHNYDLHFLLGQSSLLNKQKVSLNELPKADYYAVIQWNEFYKKPSKKLIKTIRKKVQKSNESIVIVYINSQNSNLWKHMDAATKEKVRALSN